jgi:hypothetical protein
VELTENERTQLAEILSRASVVTHVRIGRYYKAARWVTLEDLPALRVDRTAPRDQIARIVESAETASSEIDETAKTTLRAAFEAAQQSFLQNSDTDEQWAAHVQPAVTALQRAINTAGIHLESDENQNS